MSIKAHLQQGSKSTKCQKKNFFFGSQAKHGSGDVCPSYGYGLEYSLIKMGVTKIDKLICIVVVYDQLSR